MAQSQSGFLAKLFLLIAAVLLGVTIWYLTVGPAESKWHLVLTGISKGHITPAVCRFVPYRDKVMGGFAHIATVLGELTTKWKGEPYSILSLGGELSGSPEAYFTKGQAIIDALQFFHLDGMLIGNIEFTFGQKRLGDLALKSKFPFISSNIVEVGTGKPPGWAVPEVILHPDRNLTVAVLGLTPPSTPDITAKSNVETLRFLVPGADLQERTKKVRADGANIVVIMSQYNSNNLSKEAWEAIKTAKPDIFLMIDFNADPPPPALRDGILVKSISGYNQGKELDILDLTISGTPARITQFAGRRLPIFSDQMSPDAKAAEILSAVTRDVDKIKSEKLADFKGDLERHYDGEDAIGNFITDAMREAYPADVAFQNSGGIQSDIRAGAFTMGDLFNVLPFDNEIITMDLFGQEIRELLTLSASMKRGVLQTSGCSYSFSNRSAEDFELKDVLIASQPLIATRSYHIVTNAFLADGGDEFRTFKRGRNQQIGPLQREIVKAYLLNLSGKPVEGRLEGRIRRD